MGKKLKVGKARKDKFYHLAKETGYRSRSSFKLIQLNRKFQFLQKARALVDLCAAPGGWLQVASKFMPVSSLIVGVDLVPIKPVPGVITLQEDITTEKCRQALMKELKTWKVDVVLNDGAPNVGASWQHDAYSQAHLSLMALKLSCEFLSKGGWFITKVFRSKDYQPLFWIFQQFFKKVQATKPQASRNESAEIFVVCQGYLAPDKIDSKFFDPKHAFKEVEVQVKTVRELVPVRKPKAEGYADGDFTLYHRFTVTEFIKSENAVEFLAKASEITLDDEQLENHPATTQEVKECCRDIKVLGRKELRALLSWRTKLRKFIAKRVKEKANEMENEIRLSSSEAESESEGDKKQAIPDDDDEEMERKLAELKAEEVAELRRKKKKILKERRKLRERIELKMDLPGVSIADSTDTGMFSLKTISQNKVLGEISRGDMSVADCLLEEGGQEEDDIYLSDQDESDQVSVASDLDSDDLEEINERQNQLNQRKNASKRVTFTEKDEMPEGNSNELLVELEDKQQKLDHQTSLWFGKDVFAELDLDADEDIEIGQTKKLYSEQTTEKGTQKAPKNTLSNHQEVKPADIPQEKDDQKKTENDTNVDNDSDDSSSSSSDDEREIQDMKSRKPLQGQKRSNEEDQDFQVVPIENINKKARILDAEGLALGTVLATSKKKQRNLVDDSFNRYAFNEEEYEAPEWFVNDERKHRTKPIPLTREMVEEYKQRWKEINARPIKKVAEAKARKKRRMLKKMEQAKKKAEAVVNTVDISEREKVAQLKSIYKKAGIGKEKREITYVVAKRAAGPKVRRPAGVKGQFKVVDRRLKKDTRGMKGKAQQKGSGKKRK
ncbi:pre-rRNA 2'-O-ribose RNA methyltransferase FTSJ3 [Polypterus senegalus]|uniref:pre-rRNA 2'-O-ribose RNA methyltransferase FTSJ3 n=1 Tax=Polypterus senegalus TaxID=55291 RepID=UPI0019666BB6|nr:pre-rRNA 2'-O-ribose RNA methyltransferase FTSJ3 [Polypterus senegalus]